MLSFLVHLLWGTVDGSAQSVLARDGADTNLENSPDGLNGVQIRALCRPDHDVEVVGLGRPFQVVNCEGGSVLRDVVQQAVARQIAGRDAARDGVGVAPIVACLC